MANEFRIKNGFESQGNSNVTGSLTVTAGVTASLQGTASFATSASNALTASFVNPLRQSVEVQPPLFNSYGITVNPSAQFGIIAVGSINGGRFSGEGKNTTVYGVIGDTAFNGDPEAGDTLPEAIGGSFRGTSATANYSVQLQDGTEGTGKVLVSQTSDGKANWAQTVNSASRAISASFASTASYVLNAVSSSFAQTASFITTAQTASYVLNAVSSSFSSNAATASFITTSQTASYVLNAVSSSFASNAATASFITTAQTASYVLNAVSASFATSASRSISASRADSAVTASYVLNAVSSSFSSTASYVAGGGSTITGSLLTTASFADPYITFTKGDGSTFNVNLTGISSQSPQATYSTLTASISSGTTVTLPGGLTYVSSSTYEYIEVHVNGLQLRYDIDFIPTTTGSVKYLLTIPSGSEIIYKSYKRP
jgi:hypothetical protein